MSSHAHAEPIRNPGSYRISQPSKLGLLALVVLGVGCFLIQLKKNSDHAWAMFLINHFYFMSLALGGILFAAIQWLTSAMWSAPVRRIAESFTAYLPFTILTFVGVLIGMKSHVLYHHWTDTARVAADPILSGKASYLNPTFFSIRNLVVLVLLTFFSWKMIGNSIKQDQTKDYRLTLKNRVLSPPFLIVFALGFTMMSFDQLMSLDPHWFSTIFGVYCFAGLFYATFAMLCLFTLHLKKKGLLEGIVNDNHIHDIGKFMFAFTVFWAYIGFSQFMLIWYANLPEETGYFIRRMEFGWMYTTIFLLVGKFILPFIVLLPRDAKRNPRVLTVMAVWMLICQWFDLIWIVQPEFFKLGPSITVFDIFIALGFLAVFLLCAARFLGRNNIVAIGDPRLPESVFHHHQ